MFSRQVPWKNRSTEYVAATVGVKIFNGISFSPEVDSFSWTVGNIPALKILDVSSKLLNLLSDKFDATRIDSTVNISSLPICFNDWIAGLLVIFELFFLCLRPPIYTSEGPEGRATIFFSL